MTSRLKPTIVFCHGIWADGSCFSKVIPALQADGHEVIAVQYGLDSYAEDVATIKRTLNRVGSPVILVGHSYGGATITAAGTDERVAGLVFIAAVAPDVGETVQKAKVLQAHGFQELAEQKLREALASAEEMGARSLQLRVACDLAELWIAEGRQRPARALLRPIYKAFSEGLNTKDLRRATSLLGTARELINNGVTSTSTTP